MRCHSFNWILGCVELDKMSEFGWVALENCKYYSASKVHIKELRSDLSFFFCIFAENIFHLACSSRRFAHCIANVRYVYGDYQFLLYQHRKDMAGWSAMFSSTSLTLQLEEKGRQPKSVVKAKRPRTMPPAGKEGGREEGGGQLALTASCTSVKVALAAWRLLPRLPRFQLIRPVWQAELLKS